LQRSKTIPFLLLQQFDLYFLTPYPHCLDKMNRQLIFVTVFRFKFHPDIIRQHLKTIKDTMQSMQGVTWVRVFKLNNMDYQFIWDHPACSLEQYRTHGEKGKAVMASFHGQVSIIYNGIYGDASPDMISAVIQDWNSDFFANEVQIPQATPWKTSTTDALAILKLHINLHSEDAKEALKKWTESGEKMGISDIRYFQMTNQDYVQICTSSWKNMEEYGRAGNVGKELVQSMAGKIEIKEMQLYGEYPPDVQTAWMGHWHPTVVATEIKF
jgi:hypothetical protein